MGDSQNDLRELITSKDELVGSVAHDVKGLLSGIEGGIYLLNSGLKKDKQDRVDQGFAMVKRNLDRIRKTISSILYYVKKREFDWTEIDLQTLFDSVDKDLSDRAASLGVKFESRPAEGVFEADEFAAYSILVNMVDYALEVSHTAKSNPSPVVILSATKADPNVVFELSADGFAMEEETLQIVFGASYAPRGVDRSHLGLYVARELVEQHGGSLSITPNPEKNTTRFAVTMPLVTPDQYKEAADEDTAAMLEREWEGE